MKKTLFVFLLSLCWTANCVIYVPVNESYPPPEEQYYEESYPTRMDTSYFYDYLSPNGMWVHKSPYGYVWIPERVGYGWRPYTYGQWVWTDYGWTWVSSYRWGWIPFHYGRWGWERSLGWFWVPDTVWGPAWVTWRRGSLYIGWAPIPPEARFVAGAGIASLPYTLNAPYWTFVEYRYFLDSRVHRYVLPVERNINVINRTVLRTNIVVRGDRIVNRGIDIDYLHGVTKRRVTKYELEPSSRPGPTKVRVDKVEMYNPTIRKNETAKPQEVVEKSEVKDSVPRVRLKEPQSAKRPQEEGTLEQAQEREVRLLEKSQQKEIEEIKKRYQQEKTEAQDSTEKNQIDKKYQKKITKVKKSHEEEKAELKERHKKEEKKVKKKKIKKEESR